VPGDGQLGVAEIKTGKAPKLWDGENKSIDGMIAGKSLCGAKSHFTCGAATTPPPP